MVKWKSTNKTYTYNWKINNKNPTQSGCDVRVGQSLVYSGFIDYSGPGGSMS
jgi:hypothetical protein